jgi:hypothetical protein
MTGAIREAAWRLESAASDLAASSTDFGEHRTCWIAQGTGTVFV